MTTTAVGTTSSAAPAPGGPRVDPDPWLGAVVVVTSAALILLTLAPLAPAAASPPPPGDLHGLALLQRAYEAGSRVAYRGTQFMSSWTPVSGAEGSSAGGTGAGTVSVVAEVDHLPGRGTLVRLQGTPAAPDGQLFAAPADDPGALGAAATPGGGLGALSLLARNFRLMVGDPATVAGRRATVVEAVHRDGGGLAARFWVERRTGLLLRREVLDQSGHIVRASAFVELDVGPASAVRHLPPMLPATTAKWLTPAALAEVRAEGCTCPLELPGGLELYHARTLQDTSAQVLHLSYSDGLSSVSLFQQPGRVDGGELVGFRPVTIDGATVYVEDGIPQRVLWSAAGTVYTVLADAPSDTVLEVVASMPHDPPRDESGMVDRLGRGLARVGSWLNPFS